jgi:hypothetical protein
MRAFIALLTFVLPSTVFASSILAVDEATLVAKADTIAVGSVITSEAYRGTNGGIRTRFYVQVHEGLRNAREGQVIQVEVPGGTLGELTTVVTGSPQLKAGAMVVLFLESHGTSRRPLGMSYGVYRVDSDTSGTWHVGRQVDGLSLLDTQGHELNAKALASIVGSHETYQTFVARIRKRISAPGAGAQP